MNKAFEGVKSIEAHTGKLGAIKFTENLIGRELTESEKDAYPDGPYLISSKDGVLYKGDALHEIRGMLSMYITLAEMVAKFDEKQFENMSHEKQVKLLALAINTAKTCKNNSEKLLFTLGCLKNRNQ